MKKSWIASAPSNIALIKYMGKRNTEENIPDNPSISYTLPHLTSTVELKLNDLGQDMWEPLRASKDEVPISLGPKEVNRFLGHLNFLKQKFNVNKSFTVFSRNNFPGHCGLASSASSFAALTQCATDAFSEIKEADKPSIQDTAMLSKIGSGSSCRSFMGPWCLWAENSVEAIDFVFKDLIHSVVVTDGKKKKVSSSQAHKNVKSSLLYEGREQRARIRLGLMIEAFNNSDWPALFEISWAEFWDMHALFETSNPSFGYMNQDTFVVLSKVKEIWRKIGDGPIATMDAGPNVHLLFRKEQKQMHDDLMEQFRSKSYGVYTSS